MLRGHAEAVMPLIARVMDAARCEFTDLDRIAVTVGPGSFTGLRVGISAARGIALAAGKPAIGLSTLSALAAPHVAARADHDHHCGDRCAQRAGLFPCLRAERQNDRGAAARPRARRGARRAGRADGHHRLRAPRSSRRIGRAVRRCRTSRSMRRRTSAGSRVSAPPRRTRAPRRSRSICAGPMRVRRTPAGCRADELVSPACSPAPSRRSRRASPRDAASLAALHAASFSRGWSESEFEQLAHRPQRDCRSRRNAGRRNRRLHRVAPRRRRGGNSLGRGRARMARTRARAAAARPAFAPPRGPGLRAVFLEVDEDNTPARRLYARAGFREVGRRPGYYSRRKGARWCCAGTLCKTGRRHDRRDMVAVTDGKPEFHRSAMRRPRACA